ncbi:MAG TPA: hypothetical protein VFY80_00225, partial [Burkholderiales bacterium]|nr:hypothetical protein [Burkholderiales bacterium]
MRANSPRGDNPHNIDDFLRAHGYNTPEARQRARAALEAAGLTNPRKKNIAAYKLPDAERALSAALVRVCGDACVRLARSMRTERREPVITTGATCEVCGGSNNRRATITCAALLKRKKVKRVLVVGGTAPQQHDLRSLLEGDGLTLEFVDGTNKSHTQRDAIANMRRCDLVVIWGPTPLRHAVSNHYTNELVPDVRII